MPYVALKRRDAREPITADGYRCRIRELMEEGGHVAVCSRPRGVCQEGEALEGARWRPTRGTRHERAQGREGKGTGTAST
jgi:hypothetical protein